MKSKRINHINNIMTKSHGIFNENLTKKSENWKTGNMQEFDIERF